MGSLNDETDIEDFNGLILKSHYIPEEIVVLILSFIDAESLVFHCRKVCKMWKYLIDEDVLKIKVRSGKRQSFSKISLIEIMKLNLPWYIYYTILNSDPFEKNLIKNHCGQVNMEHWKLSRKGAHFRIDENNFWCVETTPQGSDPVPNHEDFDGYTSCFATSYILCEKSQIIELKEHGISKKIMNEYQPTITVSEWYAGRFDCGCMYKLTVKLLDKDKNVINEQSTPEQIVRQWEGRKWEKVELTFNDYGPGVRYIKFKHIGKDLQFWDGHYGSKMSGAVLKISLPKPKDSAAERDDNFNTFSA